MKILNILLVVFCMSLSVSACDLSWVMDSSASSMSLSSFFVRNGSGITASQVGNVVRLCNSATASVYLIQNKSYGYTLSNGFDVRIHIVNGSLGSFVGGMKRGLLNDSSALGLNGSVYTELENKGLISVYDVNSGSISLWGLGSSLGTTTLSPANRTWTRFVRSFDSLSIYAYFSSDNITWYPFVGSPLVLTSQQSLQYKNTDLSFGVAVTPNGGTTGCYNLTYISSVSNVTSNGQIRVLDSNSNPISTGCNVTNFFQDFGEYSSQMNGNYVTDSLGKTSLINFPSECVLTIPYGHIFYGFADVSCTNYLSKNVHLAFASVNNPSVQDVNLVLNSSINNNPLKDYNVYFGYKDNNGGFNTIYQPLIYVVSRNDVIFDSGMTSSGIITLSLNSSIDAIKVVASNVNFTNNNPLVFRTMYVETYPPQIDILDVINVSSVANMTSNVSGYTYGLTVMRSDVIVKSDNCVLNPVHSDGNGNYTLSGFNVGRNCMVCVDWRDITLKNYCKNVYINAPVLRVNFNCSSDRECNQSGDGQGNYGMIKFNVMDDNSRPINMANVIVDGVPHQSDSNGFVTFEVPINNIIEYKFVRGGYNTVYWNYSYSSDVINVHMYLTNDLTLDCQIFVNNSVNGSSSGINSIVNLVSIGGNNYKDSIYLHDGVGTFNVPCDLTYTASATGGCVGDKSVTVGAEVNSKGYANFICTADDVIVVRNADEDDFTQFIRDLIPLMKFIIFLFLFVVLFALIRGLHT